jgi:hypothetical protein
MATVAAAEERNVSIGRVFGRAFGTIGGNPVATLGIAFLFGALPSLLVGYLIQARTVDFVTILGPLGTIAAALVTAVVGIALAMITQGALVRATVAHSEGRRSSFGESAAAGLVVVLPLFGMAILSGLGILAGFLLLIVPGVILYVMWSVAAPALVEERLGPVAALGRSRELTRGARWKVFGLLLVVTVISWIFSAIIGLVSVMWYGGPADFASAAAAGLPLAYYAINAVFQTLSLAIWGVIQTSLYVELRDWKDGPATAKLADIFG